MPLYNNWKKDLNDSKKAVLKSLEIIKKVVKGEFYNIENSDNEILNMLDKFSGIDIINKYDNLIRGIASRVQWNKAWNSFTIRKERHTLTETELNKRLNSIKNGAFYPELTIQIYCNNKKEIKILSLGIIKTIDLYDLYLNNNNLFEQNLSDNYFEYIYWDIIKNKTNKKIYIYKNPEAKNEI